VLIASLTEYGLKDELDSAWVVGPLELVRERGRTMLPLERWLGVPTARRFHLAVEKPGTKTPRAKALAGASTRS
jgi:hypothetical protein